MDRKIKRKTAAEIASRRLSFGVDLTLDLFRVELLQDFW